MDVDFTRSLQDQFAPQSVCFGCGPANEHGLKIKSFVDPPASPAVVSNAETASRILQRNRTSGKLIATFLPEAHHLAFEGIVNGGIISVLLDCHLNWTAAWHLMLAGQIPAPPSCVTAKYEVSFHAPTPAGIPLRIEAAVIESTSRKAVVSGMLGPQDDAYPALPVIKQVTATAIGTFVAVKPDHPAFRRW